VKTAIHDAPEDESEDEPEEKPESKYRSLVNAFSVNLNLISIFG